MIFLTTDEVLHIAERTLGSAPGIRDVGLIEAAVARPQASVNGCDAYPTIHEKAAALLHSLVQNHALVDGNKRLGLACVAVFYTVNGYRLEATNDAAYELVMSIADGQRRDVAVIAPELARVVNPAPAVEGGGRGRAAPR